MVSIQLEDVPQMKGDMSLGLLVRYEYQVVDSLNIFMLSNQNDRNFWVQLGRSKASK